MSRQSTTTGMNRICEDKYAKEERVMCLAHNVFFFHFIGFGCQKVPERNEFGRLYKMSIVLIIKQKINMKTVEYGKNFGYNGKQPYDSGSFGYEIED